MGVLSWRSAGGLADGQAVEASLTSAESFAVLYERHAPALYSYAYRRVGPDVADDVVAETFTVAFRHRARYDLNRPDARPWLFGILTKEISRYRRKEGARLRAVARYDEPFDEDSHAERVADEVTARAARAALAAALHGLSAGDRDVLLLIAWGGLNNDEVADALGIPAGTVRSRLHRARRQVKAALGDNPLRAGEE
ncbi:sigma-70 family RNA polymerase sigma factor [Dactylosporangium sp. NPDC051485]|uniref:RNA polymerase sigma factor n=1 Tax=Dactylosporangium sp. NPDC051485 TaxID=3154846 RepID=UPI00342806DA